MSFPFSDYGGPPGIPSRPIFTENARLEIRLSEEPAQPLRLDGWPESQAVSDPITALSSHAQTVISETRRTVDGTEATQINAFRDFVGNLDSYVDPALWEGLTVEAIFRATSQNEWLRGVTGSIKPAEFDKFYGIDPVSRSELEDISDYRVTGAWPCTLDVFVSGAKVATLQGYLAAVWEHDEDVRGLYVARFVEKAGTTD